MPGGRKKRRLTPNSTPKETKSKRVRKDSDAFKAGTASSKHEETSQEGITTLTLKRWDTSKYFFLLLFVFTYVYHVQWDIPFLSPHLICKAFFSKFWLDPLRIMNLGSNIGRRNPYFANYCVPKLLFYVIRGFGIVILCFNLHFNFSICVGWRNLFLFLFWGVRIFFLFSFGGVEIWIQKFGQIRPVGTLPSSLGLSLTVIPRPCYTGSHSYLVYCDGTGVKIKRVKSRAWLT